MKLCVCIILHQCFSSGPKGGGGETYQLGESDIYLYIFKGEEKKVTIPKKKKKKSVWMQWTVILNVYEKSDYYTGT